MGSPKVFMPLGSSSLLIPYCYYHYWRLGGGGVSAHCREPHKCLPTSPFHFRPFYSEARLPSWQLYRNARVYLHLECSSPPSSFTDSGTLLTLPSCFRSRIPPSYLHINQPPPTKLYERAPHRQQPASSGVVPCEPQLLDTKPPISLVKKEEERNTYASCPPNEYKENGMTFSLLQKLQQESAAHVMPAVASNPSQQVARSHTLPPNTPLVAESSFPITSMEESQYEKEAWELLESAISTYCGSPIGTIAAKDPTDPNPQNYDQVFLRDFIPSAIAFLLKGRNDIVRNFILHTLQLQSWEKTVDSYTPGQGLMPASFKVRVVPRDGDDGNATEEILDPDFGEAAIGRVAPVDSGLWWIILLRAYGRCTGDLSLQERIDVQTGVKMILKLCLADGFDMFPTLLVTDGSCMIDRRMGIHGHPLEIQVLFYSALRCAREMLTAEDSSMDLIRAVNNRLIALSFHIREYYWVDMKKLNEIYRYKTEEYSYDAVNKFNIYPEQIPHWLVEWMPNEGGYLIGNLQPAHMDFRFFSLGNLWAIIGSLATSEQSNAILDLIEAKWSDLVGNMPFKICYPALESDEWRIITGSDPKNTPWSCHNGGSWPTLLWQLAAASIKMKRPEIAKRALEVAESRLAKDRWPEYYDTRSGKFVGKQARLYQTWSIAGYLVAKLLLRRPEAAYMLTCEEDMTLLEALSSLLKANPKRKRARKFPKKTFIV